MKAIVKLTPKIDIEIEERTGLDTLYAAINLAGVRDFCTECGKPTKPQLTARKAKDAKGVEFVYIEAVCKNILGKEADGKPKYCWAKSGLGQYQTGGFFWKKYERYEGTPES